VGICRKTNFGVLQGGFKVIEKKRILFISDFAGFIGGTEKYIYSVAKFLKENGFVCDMIYRKKTLKFDIFESVFENCVDWKNATHLKDIKYDFATMHRTEDADFLEYALDNFSPTLFVHDHTYVCPKGYKYYPYKRINCERKYGRIACGLCSLAVPPRHFANGFSELVKRSFVEMPKLNSVAMRFKNFVVISNFMCDELVKNGVDKKRIHLLPAFVESFSQCKKDSTKPLKILFAGQHVISKGLHLLLESVAKMKEDFFLTILGNGSRTPYFKDIAKHLKLNEKIEFVGFVDNPVVYYQSCDVVVFPSLWQEPFGLVGIEAMANSKCVVGFDVGGVSDWLKNAENGIIVKRRDTLAFASALDKLACDSSLRKRLGKNGYSFVAENFSKEKFLKSFLELI